MTEMFNPICQGFLGINRFMGRAPCSHIYFDFLGTYSCTLNILYIDQFIFKELKDQAICQLGLKPLLFYWQPVAKYGVVHYLFVLSSFFCGKMLSDELMGRQKALTLKQKPKLCQTFYPK